MINNNNENSSLFIKEIETPEMHFYFVLIIEGCANKILLNIGKTIIMCFGALTLFVRYDS